MFLYPAIDLLGGRCVRLRQGDYSRETVFSDDPAAVARRWVDAGAIQTLKLIGSPRSQRILEEAQQRNQSRARQISGALDYIKSNPGILADADLEALAKRVAAVIKIGDWKGNGTPRLNEAGDKALVDFTFQTSTDRLVYTATFHRRDGAWTLRGAHETSQAFVVSGSFRPKQ